MNHDAADSTPLTPGERFLDAALSEHARLGQSGSDDELVLRILRETVHRPAAVRTVRPSLDRKTVAVAFGAVAAVATAAILVLSSLPVETGSRRSDELRFVVRLEGPEASVPPSGTAPQQPAARHEGPIAFSGPNATPAFSTPTSPTLARVDLVISPELSSTFGPLPERGVRHENLRITAARSRNSENGLAYEGEVVVEHERFRIEAARIDLPASDAGEATLFAESFRVEHAATGCVAEGASLAYDPVTDTLLLTGIRRVTTREGEMSRFSPGDRIVLAANSFSVERAPVETHASPLPKSRP